ncbi:hypothetical protein HDC90_004760 [Pedobacter sp. AK013]|uniref:O-antigen polymerase n=1 Tax=Pedobacter sp. AK013 TaxID=2723071 RepID=UPI00160EA909|nr:O-antigen polymerase [Pedobacter sp. AK013]MBB6240096.1 hypothetical protein [Pedobacter sp. AK013]
MTNLIICLSLCIFYLGTYVIWFDRRNIFNHFFIGFCLVAYVIPVCVIDFEKIAGVDILNLYSIINLIGAISFVVGLLIGNKWKKIGLIDQMVNFKIVHGYLSEPIKLKRFLKVCDRMYLFGIIGVTLSFVLMGFVPIFASDPILAKFFKGEYQEPYKRVAYIYRTSRLLIELLLPLKILQILNKWSLKNMSLIVWGLALIIFSLNRGPMLTGLLLALSIIFSLNKSRTIFFSYIGVIVMSVLIGSSLYYILAIFSPFGYYGGLDLGSNVFEAISFGSPDISDQLTFLNQFVQKGSDFTYGLTFIGGLIPFNFKYSPSSWTLFVANDTSDISEIASGGFRIPVSMWGYTSFGWFGVVLVPFLSAFFIGYIVRKIKPIIRSLDSTFSNRIKFYFISFIYLNVLVVFTNYYLISIYLLPPLIIYFLLLKTIKRRAAPIKSAL